MRNYEQAKQNWMVVCKQFQNWDRNGAHLDDIEERSEPENLKFEAEIYKEMINEWYREDYITMAEHKYLMDKIEVMEYYIEEDNE